MFEQADLDGNGVSPTDHDLARRIRLAQQRASAIQTILRDDLDDDGRVTRAELIELHTKEANRPMTSSTGVRIDPTPEQVSQMVPQLISRELTVDTNGDAVITWDETLAEANAQAQRHENRYSSVEPIPLMLDGNGDGIVSKAEFIALIDSAFYAADLDRDGGLSKAERAALTAKVRVLRQEERAAHMAEEKARALTASK